MPEPNLVILYVDSPPANAALYSDLLGLRPVESSPTFAMFAMESSAMLGLWARRTVQPAANMTGGRRRTRLFRIRCRSSPSPAQRME